MKNSINHIKISLESITNTVAQAEETVLWIGDKVEESLLLGSN
jgi:hypothetical protein